MDISITAATKEGSGLVLASFGSGDTGGRLQSRARGTARNQNASAAETRALRSRIQRSQNGSAAARRRLLQEIADNTKSNGTIRRGVLADIASDLDDL